MMIMTGHRSFGMIMTGLKSFRRIKKFRTIKSFLETYWGSVEINEELKNWFKLFRIVKVFASCVWPAWPTSRRHRSARPRRRQESRSGPILRRDLRRRLRHRALWEGDRSEECWPISPWQEADIYMHRSIVPLSEGEVSHWTPESEGCWYLLVNLSNRGLQGWLGYLHLKIVFYMYLDERWG